MTLAQQQTDVQPGPHYRVSSNSGVSAGAPEPKSSGLSTLFPRGVPRSSLIHLASSPVLRPNAAAAGAVALRAAAVRGRPLIRSPSAPPVVYTTLRSVAGGTTNDPSNGSASASRGGTVNRRSER